jgi:hypothetical protein
MSAPTGRPAALQSTDECPDWAVIGSLREGREGYLCCMSKLMFQQKEKQTLNTKFCFWRGKWQERSQSNSFHREHESRLCCCTVKNVIKLAGVLPKTSEAKILIYFNPL